jgi:hypothetical protein
MAENRVGDSNVEAEWEAWKCSECDAAISTYTHTVESKWEKLNKYCEKFFHWKISYVAYQAKSFLELAPRIV